MSTNIFANNNTEVNVINFFMMEVPIISKPVYWFANKSVDWLLYGRDLRRERFKKLEFLFHYLQGPWRDLVVPV